MDPKKRMFQTVFGWLCEDAMSRIHFDRSPYGIDELKIEKVKPFDAKLASLMQSNLDAKKALDAYVLEKLKG